MNRTLQAVAALLAVSPMVTTEAHALEPYMWGVGGRLGTYIIPARYPVSFPTKIANYNFIDEGPRAGDEDSDDPKRDLDEDGDPIYTTLQKVGFQGQISVDGMYAIDAENRIGALAGFTTGKGYSDAFFMFNYDRVLLSDDSGFDLVAGGYAGFGTMSFRGRDADGVKTEEKLRVPHFPLRAHIEAQLRNKTQKYGLGLFAGTNVPSNHYFTDQFGQEVDDVGSPFNLALYVYAGLEASVQFGDFTPPKKKKPTKTKKGGGGKKGGGSAKKKKK